MNNPERITISDSNHVKLVSKQYPDQLAGIDCIRVINRRLEFMTKRGIEYTVEVIGNDMEGFKLNLVEHPLGIYAKSTMPGCGSKSVKVFESADQLAQWFAKRPQTFHAGTVTQINILANGSRLYFRGRTSESTQLISE